MNTNTFESLLARLPGLSHKQIRDLLRYISSLKTDKMRVMEKIHSKDASVVCPKCCSKHHYKWGKSKDLQRFRCRDCQATYTFLSGTPLSSLRYRGQWLNYINELIQGSTVRHSAKVCGIDSTTSFRWRHRFLQMLNDAEESHLEGIVEMDETFFLESEKGSRQLNRKPRKRGGTAVKRGRSKEHTAVVIGLDRSGHVLNFTTKTFNSHILAKELLPKIDEEIVLCSDASSIYRSLAAKENILHKSLNISAGVRVIDGVYHIQHINAYHSRLKEWMARFHGVATKYLNNYINWRRILERSKKVNKKTEAWLDVAMHPNHFQQVP